MCLVGANMHGWNWKIWQLMLERQQQAMIFGFSRVNAMCILDITAVEQTDNVGPMNYEQRGNYTFIYSHILYNKTQQ